MKYVHQSNKDICLLSDAKNVNITTPCAKDSKINKLKDFQSHGHDSSTMDVFVIKDDQMRQLPTTSDPNFCNVNHGQLTEHFEQVQSSSSLSSEINSKKVLSQSCKTERHGKIGASENVLYNSLANESLRKESSSNSKQNSQCIDKATKIVHSSCNMLFNQLIPRTEPAFRNPQPSTSGKCPLPRSVHAESHQKEKHRISVWDRLGKPCDGVPSGVKTVELCDGLGTVIQKQELLNQHKAVLPVLNSELRGSMTGGVTGRGNIQPESRKLERSTRTMHEAHAANNIRRKRHFGEICSDQDALAGCSRKELQCLDFSQFSKRSNMIKEDYKATPNLISEVLDVKQKLHKIELEMSKLRSKQVEMEKDGKSNLLSRSSRWKNSCRRRYQDENCVCDKCTFCSNKRSSIIVLYQVWSG